MASKWDENELLPGVSPLIDCSMVSFEATYTLKQTEHIYIFVFTCMHTHTCMQVYIHACMCVTIIISKINNNKIIKINE